ncbi:MAG: DoxX family protein [Halioglobus sp.]
MLDNTQPFERLMLLVGRGLLGIYFILPGISKITGFAATSEYMAAHGVPLIPVLLVVTIVVQIGGGLALMFGFKTQVVAFVLAGLILVINLFMHNFWVMEEGMERNHELQNFVKNLAIMAGLLFVAGARLGSSTTETKSV